MAMYKYGGMFERKCRLYGGTQKEFWGDALDIGKGLGKITIDLVSVGISKGITVTIAGIEMVIEIAKSVA